MWNKWIYTMFVLALGLFASCSDSSEEQLAEAGKTRTVVFRLSMEDINGRSRATWAEDYNSGTATDFDVKINVDGLQVVVYTAQGNYVGKAEKVFFSKLNNSGNDNNAVVDYEFVGDVSQLNLQDNTAYKFMVFANCSNVGDMTAVGEHPYDISDLATAIPMWGVTTYTLTTLTSQDLGIIHLLRAAAKIEVALGETIADYLLESVTISRHNTRGYIAPKYWNTVETTESLDQDDCANFHSTLSTDPLPFTQAANGMSAKVYVPEYQNTSLGNAPAKITVSLKRGVSTADPSDDGIVEFKDAIQFCTYSNGTPTNQLFDIVRNHHYKFTITGVSGGLEIQYAVMDWVDAGKVELNYTYPTYHNPLLPALPIENENVSITDEPTMYYTTNNSEEGAFKAYFHITAPTGQRWTPTFKQSQENYKIQVFQGNKLMYDSSNTNENQELVASPDWYEIRVFPLEGAEVGNIVNLGITCKMGDTSENNDALESTPFYLLINGTTNGDIRWPDSGSDPRFIAIKHVAEPQSTNP